MSAKILIIYDDTRIRELISKYLSDNGYECLVAENTKIAKEKLSQNTINFIIADVMLPEEDGITFTENLRKKSNIPLLILSAVDEVDKRIEALEVGADDYMLKPFEPKELLLRIQKILKR